MLHIYIYDKFLMSSWLLRPWNNYVTTFLLAEIQCSKNGMFHVFPPLRGNGGGRMGGGVAVIHEINF